MGTSRKLRKIQLIRQETPQTDPIAYSAVSPLPMQRIHPCISLAYILIILAILGGCGWGLVIAWYIK